MAETNMVNRKYKDRLIRYLFKEKKEMLSLYNAVNHSNYTNENELEIYTMEDFVYMGMKNDMACLIDWSFNLFEHQSTWNPNMPLRGYLYTAHSYQKYLSIHRLDIHSSSLVAIPVPQYYVLYNGERKIPDEVTLRLTDSMIGEDTKEKSCAEFTAHVLNINDGHNQELMDACPLLKEYARYIAKIREYHVSGMEMKEAVEQATAYCIKNNILADILLANKAEVTDMILTEYDEAFHIRNEKEISYKEGQESQKRLVEEAKAEAKEAQAREEEAKAEAKEAKAEVKKAQTETKEAKKRAEAAEAEIERLRKLLETK